MKERVVYAVFILIAILGFSIYYEVDKSACYDKASNYNAKVKSYSFIKDYCFVNMNGKTVNLENYRDVLEIE